MSVNYVQLVEGSRALIIDYIKANIGAALDVVGANVGVPQVTLENPVEYFIYPKAKGLQLPALFVICDQLDFRIQEMKSNFVNAKEVFKISALVEDQNEDNLTYKVDRYLSALYEVLNQANIISTDGSLKVIVVPYRASFSPIYMREESTGDGGKFRKEIVLECEVEHLENF